MAGLVDQTIRTIVETTLHALLELQRQNMTHSHPDDEVFFVLDEWVYAPTGSFALVPGDVTHDFGDAGC